MRKFGLALLVAMLGVSVDAASCDSEEMKGMIESVNKISSQRIDSVTTVMGAECEDGSLKYLYRLNDDKEGGIEFSQFDETQKQAFYDTQKNILNQIYCTSFRQLWEYTNGLIWYYEFDGKEFVRFEFKPSDCDK